MTRKSGKHPRVTYGAAVSTLLDIISSAHRNFHHWRSNQQPQNAEAETLPLGHRFIPRISDAELTSHGDNMRPLDLMCLEEDTATSRATSSQVGVMRPHNITSQAKIFIILYIIIYIYIYIYVCVCVCVCMCV